MNGVLSRHPLKLASDLFGTSPFLQLSDLHRGFDWS